MAETETRDKPKQIEKHKPINFSEFDDEIAKFIAEKIFSDWRLEDFKPLDKKLFRFTKTSENGSHLALVINSELKAINFVKPLKGTEFNSIDLVFPASTFTLGEHALIFEHSVDKRRLIFYSTLYRIDSTEKEKPEKPQFQEEIQFD